MPMPPSSALMRCRVGGVDPHEAVVAVQRLPQRREVLPQSVEVEKKFIM
jgi:hypothetical protein